MSKPSATSLTFLAVFLMAAIPAAAQTKARKSKPVHSEETKRKVEEIRLEQAIRARMRALHQQQGKEESTAQADRPRTIDQIWYEIEQSVEADSQEPASVIK